MSQQFSYLSRSDQSTTRFPPSKGSSSSFSLVGEKSPFHSQPHRRLDFGSFEASSTCLRLSTAGKSCGHASACRCQAETPRSCGVRMSCSSAARLSALFRPVLHVSRQQPTMSRTIEHCGKRDDAYQNPEGQKYIHGDQQPPVYAHLFVTSKRRCYRGRSGYAGTLKATLLASGLRGCSQTGMGIGGRRRKVRPPH
jgi:hypothetical protein